MKHRIRLRWRPRKLQWLRRAVQLLVAVAVLAIPVLAHYSNYLASREVDALMERWQASPQGAALRTVDGALRRLPGGEKERAGRRVRDDDRAAERLRGLRGNAWSLEAWRVSLTDPLAAAESFAASRRAVRALVVSLLIPLAVTLLLGRVFCSWICPMGLLLELTDKLRGLLGFLEVRVFDVRFPRATKLLVLAIGVGLAFLWAVPVLGTIYPPAVIGREARGFVSALFERAELGSPGWGLAGLSVASLFIAGIALIEVVVSRRWWCRAICPGGALYALLGRFRVVRVLRDKDACTACGECVRVCGMGLVPMKDRMGIDCDNCGLCISHCDDGALGYRLVLELPVAKKRTVPKKTVVAGLLLFLAVVPASLHAHHILGIPHYAYDESYPQAPVITYRTRAGEHEVEMTGYPGRPVPGERTSLHVHVSPCAGTGAPPFDGEVTLRVLRDGVFGARDEIYGPMTAGKSEGLYKFFPTFDAEDNYLVRIDFRIDGVPWTIDLPVVVGEPGSPLMAVGGFAGGLLALLVMLRAVRIKLRRRREAAGEGPA